MVGVAGLQACKIPGDPGCSLPLFWTAASPGREAEEGQWWDGVPWDGSRAAGPWALALTLPLSPSLCPPPQHQEHLSSTLAALRSNQITLKVCRFWKFFRPLSAKRLPGHRAQHCTFPGPMVISGELWVQQLAVKVAMTWLPSPQLGTFSALVTPGS